jgi:hypothetical protein
MLTSADHEHEQPTVETESTLLAALACRFQLALHPLRLSFSTCGHCININFTFAHVTCYTLLHAIQENSM